MITGRDVIGFDLVEFSPIEKIEAYNFTAATLIYKVIELINLNKS